MEMTKEQVKKRKELHAKLKIWVVAFSKPKPTKEEKKKKLEKFRDDFIFYK